MKRITSILVASLFLGFSAFSQNFEQEQITGEDFEELKVKVGADFAIQLQALDHETPNIELKDIKRYESTILQKGLVFSQSRYSDNFYLFFFDAKTTKDGRIKLIF